MIGKNIKTLRLNAGLTLKELAKKLGKEYNQYSKIENEKVSPNDETIMEILVKALEVPFSKAKDLVAQWRAEEAIAKAANPERVREIIVAGDNSIIISGNNNSIS